MSPADYLDLVSGRWRGLSAAAMRAVLGCAEGPYALAVAARNAWYDRRGAAVTRVEVPVVSVGNLTLGGTGKTPMVKWIARRLRQNGRRVALLSRGYGAEAGAKNDEALELEHALPDVPHLLGADRVANARVAIDELESEVLLLDDGFQHRRLGRDLDIVLLDATEPFGYGHLFPRGVLREPVGSLKRAHAVCLTRADSIDSTKREALRKRVERAAPGAVWCEASHRPRSLLAAGAEVSRPIEELRGRRVAAFCGIGNPSAFRSTLEQSGAEVVWWREFPDHHAYRSGDISEIQDAIDKTDAEIVVCTHKDLVKVQLEEIADRPLLAVVVEIDFSTGEQQLGELIDRVTGQAS